MDLLHHEDPFGAAVGDTCESVGMVRDLELQVLAQPRAQIDLGLHAQEPLLEDLLPEMMALVHDEQTLL
jgi:hypothetical protein